MTINVNLNETKKIAMTLKALGVDDVDMKDIEKLLNKWVSDPIIRNYTWGSIERNANGVTATFNDYSVNTFCDMTVEHIGDAIKLVHSAYKLINVGNFFTNIKDSVLKFFYGLSTAFKEDYKYEIYDLTGMDNAAEYGLALVERRLSDPNDIHVRRSMLRFNNDIDRTKHEHGINEFIDYISKSEPAVSDDEYSRLNSMDDETIDKAWEMIEFFMNEAKSKFDETLEMCWAEFACESVKQFVDKYYEHYLSKKYRDIFMRKNDIIK